MKHERELPTYVGLSMAFTQMTLALRQLALRARKAAYFLIQVSPLQVSEAFTEPTQRVCMHNCTFVHAGCTALTMVCFVRSTSTVSIFAASKRRGNAVL